MGARICCLAFLGFLLADCFSPNYGAAPFLCQDRPECPEGYSCVEGVCQNGGALSDGDSSDASIILVEDLPGTIYPDGQGLISPDGIPSEGFSRPDGTPVDSTRRFESGVVSEEAWKVDTDAEWKAGSKSQVVVQGAGSAAVLTLDSAAGSALKYPTGVAQAGGGHGWDSSTLPNVRAADGKSARYDPHKCCSGDDFLSTQLRTTGYGFAVPTTSTITGIKGESNHHQSGTASMVKDYEVYLIANGSPAGQNKASAVFWSQGAQLFGYGGSSDRWGLNLAPATVNRSDFGLALRAKNHSTVYTPSAYVDYLRLTVYYRSRYTWGTYVSGAIPWPSTAKSWDRIEIQQAAPTGCGTNALTYDVLRASDGSALLTNQTTSTISLLTVEHVDLKIKAKLATADASVGPAIDSMRVYVLK